MNTTDENAAKDARLEQLLQDAEAATAMEHRMGLFEALRTYPKAAAWSMALSVAVIMEGKCPSSPHSYARLRRRPRRQLLRLPSLHEALR